MTPEIIPGMNPDHAPAANANARKGTAAQHHQSSTKPTQCIQKPGEQITHTCIAVSRTNCRTDRPHQLHQHCSQQTTCQFASYRSTVPRVRHRSHGMCRSHNAGTPAVFTTATSTPRNTGTRTPFRLNPTSLSTSADSSRNFSQPKEDHMGPRNYTGRSQRHLAGLQNQAHLLGQRVTVPRLLRIRPFDSSRRR